MQSFQDAMFQLTSRTAYVSSDRLLDYAVLKDERGMTFVMVRTRIIPIIRDGHVLLSCRFSQNIFRGVKFYNFSLEPDKTLLSLYDHERKSIQWHTSYHRTRTELRYSQEIWRSRILIAREIIKWLSLMPNNRQISSVLGLLGMFITDLFMVQEADG